MRLRDLIRGLRRVCTAWGAARRPVTRSVARGASAAPIRLDETRIAPPAPVEIMLRPRVCADLGHVTGLELARPEDETPLGGADPTLDAIDHAARIVGRLRRRGLDPGLLSMTVPRRALARSDLIDRIAFTLDAHDLRPGDLELRLPHRETAERIGGAVRALGCRVALPAGSDAVLRGEADTCWIAAALVRDVASDPARRGLVSAVLRRAERQGLDSSATGVSTAADAALLAQLGCGHLSGPAIAPPLRERELAAWIAQRQGQAPSVGRAPWVLEPPFDGPPVGVPRGPPPAPPRFRH